MLRLSERYWVRDEDGRIYEAVWTDDKNGYWWDLEGESPVDPVEFMPHPQDKRFSGSAGAVGCTEKLYEGDEIASLRDRLNETARERDHFYNQFRTAWAALTPQSENEKRGFERVLAILHSKQKDAVEEGNGFGPNWSARNKAFKECAEMLRLALSAQVQDVVGSPAIKAIAAERARQIEKEGWSPEHDDKYTNGELLEAAACYALHNSGELDDAPGAWPWSRDFWKPTSRQRDLEKAGALIAAELDRVMRAAAPAKQEGGL
ncbi:hypothetical protein AGR6A_Cc150138 [Agrobacterium sp. NCPPB 925]|nr:hypothetical protein AGR6A_Cc150138 [Agrobacterium sp. NCPPB 925]